MKTEWRIFGGLSLFIFAMAVLYPLWTNAALGHVDWVGTIALILTGLLCIMIGGYFWFVSRRIVWMALNARTKVSWVNSSASERSLTMSKMKLMTGREYLSKIRRKASESPAHTRVTRSAELFIRVPAKAPG